MKTFLVFLSLVYDSIEKGVVGMYFGWNIFKVDDSIMLLKVIMKNIH
ncbi:MAG: hypothetical protein ACTSRH_05670 [Promethearchaeota archaeon]